MAAGMHRRGPGGRGFRAGTGFKLHVQGLSSFSLTLGPHTTSPNIPIGVSVDYGPFTTVNVSEGANNIPLGLDSDFHSDARHVLRIDSWGWVDNRVNLESIALNHGAQLLPYTPSKLAFEFIGDSLSAAHSTYNYIIYDTFRRGALVRLSLVLTVHARPQSTLGPSLSEGATLIVIAISDAVNEAAAAAIQLQDYTSALEWLEQGRAIVWGQMIHLRTPVDDLRAEDPALAKELQDVSRQLERAGYPQNSGSTAEAADRLSIQQEVDLHHKLAARWESLIETVRSLPGFENFLRPRTIAELSLATHGGAIVVVNMHKSRCDALILRRTPDVQLQHVALPRMSYQRGLNLRSLMLQMLSSSNVRQADSKLTRSQASDELLLSPEFWSNVVEPALEDQLEPERGGRIASVGNMSLFERILKVLWLDLVKPVVDALGYERKPDSTLSEDLPHVTWCGTGPMAFLPLHAAGVYDDSDQAQQVFEYVVSSYTPSITPLLVTRFPTNQPPPKGILAISQSATLNKPALPGAAKELDAIKEYFNGSDISCLQDKSATVTNVIKAMDERPWIHLACHGVQRADDPTKSGFCLKDGMLELSAIMEKSLQHAELAFLSACQTATGDEKRPDEGIHLAAGMLLAGYRSVLGTMWSIKDRDSPFIADEVYKYLLRNEAEPNSRRAAYALHQAVARFRTTLQKNDFVQWVPFIHIGSAYSLQYNVPIATRTTLFAVVPS
ncbi:hypothetical protein EVG20_g7702 [Dentipellis fragilis]|uniref:CHAT domain-containing protein n=1 Tax=Dentipellis fragilis TaxID=205917 RepID=A0A4Y9YDM0_9AGAM|nr:hypothetical protein EVG20_g7702 [Dentipellis fragilis]